MLRKIASFTINHDTLTPGMYISRVDGDCVTYDLRCKWPNRGDYLAQAPLHTIEHLVATYVRSSEMSDQVVYFGPMGCRTGFYLLLGGNYSSKEVLPLVRDCFRFIEAFRGDVPGASAKDCGNFLDMNLPMANYWGKKYADLLDTCDDSRLVYPK